MLNSGTSDASISESNSLLSHEIETYDLLDDDTDDTMKTETKN